MPQRVPMNTGGNTYWLSPGRKTFVPIQDQRAGLDGRLDGGQEVFGSANRFLVEVPGMNGLSASLARQAGAELLLGFVEGAFRIHSRLVRFVVCFLDPLDQEPDIRIGGW